MTQMTSRERMIAAMRGEAVDRVPVPQTFWRGDPDEQRFRWNSLKDEIAWMRRYGFDPYIPIPLPQIWNREIDQKSWTEENLDEPYPILCAEWSSPRGRLTAKVRVSDDYPHKRIPLFDDFNTPRFTKPLICNGEDLLTLVHMDPWGTPAGDDLKDWRQQGKERRRLADSESLALSSYGGTALDYMIWSSLADQAIMLVLDYPRETAAFLEYLNTHTEQMLALCIEAGADFVLRRGWYDSADFWGPEQFTAFAAPFISRTVAMSHDAGLPCCYYMCTGVEPLLDEIAALDFDCLVGVEPAATGQNLTRIVDALGGRKAFWTGISAPLQIGMGTTDQVREAVRDAHALFGRRGFLLAAVPSIRRHWPWENVEAMMDEHARIEQEIPRSLCQ